MKIGILAVQGAFIEHAHMLDKLGVDHFEIRQKKDLESNQLDGLILPGGESTVMGKLARELDLYEPLKEAIENGTPTFGTCAGLILLANQLSNDNRTHFGTMDISVKRNAYGRQLGSFETTGVVDEIGEVPMVFIRAPYIESTNDKVKVLAKVDDHIVAARQDNMLATAFHPELSEDTSIHQYFINMVEKAIAN